MLVHNNIQELPPFEELVELALHNPKAFSMLRHDICEEMILSASPDMQKRLWDQQIHIDQVLNNCQTPDDILVNNSQERSEPPLGEVYDFRLPETDSIDSVQTQVAEVIPFPRRATTNN